MWTSICEHWFSEGLLENVGTLLRVRPCSEPLVFSRAQSSIEPWRYHISKPESTEAVAMLISKAHHQPIHSNCVSSSCNSCAMPAMPSNPCSVVLQLCYPTSTLRLYGSFNCIIYDHVSVCPEPIRSVDGPEAAACLFSRAVRSQEVDSEQRHFGGSLLRPCSWESCYSIPFQPSRVH